MAKLVAILTITVLVIVGGMMVSSSAKSVVSNATQARTSLLDSIN